MIGALLGIGVAWAAPPASNSLPWDDLSAHIHAAWAQGPGQAAAARADGALAARTTAAIPAPSLFAQLQPDPLGRRHPLDGTQFAVQLDVGAGGAARRQAWATTATRWLADDEAARLAYTYEVQDAWLAWWVTHELAGHLDRYATDLDARLQPLRRGAARGEIASTRSEDLDVELARVRAEVVDLDTQARTLQGRIASLLAEDVVPVADGMPDIEALDVLPSNPWPTLVTQMSNHPDVVALHAQVAEAEAQARAVRLAPSAQVGLGAAFLDGGADGLIATPLLVLQVPLAHPEGAAVRSARAEAEARSAEASWRERELTAWAAQQALAFDNAVVRVEALTVQVEAPLQARHDRVWTAFEAGAADLPTLVLAVRDLHEAHHAHTLAVADLWSQEARARALAACLHASRSPE